MKKTVSYIFLLLWAVMSIAYIMYICINIKYETDMEEEVYAGNMNYYNNNYKKAIYHYIKAYEYGKKDGIVLYRIAYSAEQISGLTSNVEKYHSDAFFVLKTQYQNHKYYRYAKEKIFEFYINNQYGVAENGDVSNYDNDGDGRVEPVYVRGYFRKDGTYVRSHYRARPR